MRASWPEDLSAAEREQATAIAAAMPVEPNAETRAAIIALVRAESRATRRDKKVHLSLS